MHTIVEDGTTMCNEYSDVLQQDRDLDGDHNRTVNGILDRRELRKISVRSAHKSN